MHKQKQQLIAWGLILSWLALACAQPGEGPGAGARRKKRNHDGEEEEKKSKPKTPTFIGISLLGQDSPIPPLCSEASAPPRFFQLGTHFSLDGLNTEWNTQPQTTDSFGDEKYFGLDLRQSYLGTAQKDLRNDIVGSLVFGSEDVLEKISAGHAAYLEFGHLFTNEANELVMQGDRLFRFDAQGFSEKINGTWDIFARLGEISVKGGFEIQDEVIEWMLDERQLDDVTSHPTWWVRVYSETASSGLASDSSAVTYFGGQQPGTKLRVCQANSRDKAPFSFSELHTTDIPEQSAQRVFDVVRMAYENLQNLLDYKDFAISHFTVAVARSKRAETFPLLSNLPKEWDLLNGVFVHLDGNLAVQMENEQYDELYTNVCRFLLEYYLREVFPEAPTYLQELVKNLTVAELEGKVLGLYSWLNAFRTHTQAFQKFVEPAENFSIPQWATVNPSDLNLQAKIWSLAYVLAQKISAKKALEIWHELARVGNSGQALETFLVLIEEAAEEEADVHQLWPGWLKDDAYTPAYAPATLADADYDGMPAFFEQAKLTNKDNIDSDKDGWSDLAELFQARDPMDNTSKPSTIIADNYFDDWEELLPDQIAFHDGVVLPNCPAWTRVGSTAALLADRKLIVGILANQAWSGNDAVTWETQIDVVPARRKFLITARSGDYFYRILDAKTEATLMVAPTLVPQSIRASEWLVDFDRLDIAKGDLKKGAVKIRVTSIIESSTREVCDQSGWFSPTLQAN